MTETAQSLPLPIPCPVCDQVLTTTECPCGFHLERAPEKAVLPGEVLYEGHPVLL